jgi:hypothetical protein
MTTNSFKAGDVVRCIDNTLAGTWLTRGATYVVADDWGSHGLRLNGVEFPAAPDRFELVATGSSPLPLPSPSPSPAPRPTCETCPHWLNQETAAGYETVQIGECHGHPPVLSPEIATPGQDIEDLTELWLLCRRPVTCGTETCGEHPDMPAWIARLKSAE